ncbi:helix-turn-helix transcriptional regulator [Nocardiopsis eucommiae]|uniref:Helix-turn-helix transcriptional regulator n=1 Tax=Nocardiopsis eucommiae TaxID=2831970 RepID=A0A975LDR0_9ACTN|nr:helix-turn-helix transcriptional regulator [Nocardiopsis eucommiae]
MALATREAILTCAYDLFREHGYAEVTIGDIAKAAMVAVPTVYNSVGARRKSSPHCWNRRSAIPRWRNRSPPQRRATTPSRSST